MKSTTDWRVALILATRYNVEILLGVETDERRRGDDKKKPKPKPKG